MIVEGCAVADLKSGATVGFGHGPSVAPETGKKKKKGKKG